MLGYVRRHLAAKLFLSYLVIIWVVFIVLAVATEFALPGVFHRRFAAAVNPGTGSAPSTQTLVAERELYLGFRRGVNEALAVAGAVAFAAAAVTSVVISRQVVTPVRDMMSASLRIAGGDVQERIAVPGDEAGGDLDELARLAVSFNHMAAHLAQAESLRRELIGNVAHELRTPLATVKGVVEGLIDGVLPPEASTFHLITREADRLQRLVQDLEELSRVEAGAFELRLEPVSVARLAETVAARLGRQFDDKGIALELDVPADLPRVLADEGRMGQVLLNLVGNALQYTPPGGQVWLRARRGACPDRPEPAGDTICLSVQDTGIGIAPEHIPHLFTRFYRADKSRSRAGGGSGIGLTIARHLVQAHGGEIWVASPGLGRGSTFHLTLPIA